ncbi:hypothetical protein F4805DRAFT_452351 [Annulohypoxylon moriforme]|nr:hypothetical protein F4805DRAFT_452351 [Annulohypoxylon moriforme]
MDRAPPPPYSETDAYSHPGRSPATRAGSNDDATSVTESSTHGTPIYTPPETPRESHFNFPGVDDYRSIDSARSYFESRPTFVNRPPGQNLVTSLAITDNASPENFPYPGWASEHDTTEQDWQTFLNYLLPEHAARSNSQTIDRKLQAENDAESSKSERSIAEAQLGQIKSSSNLPLRPSHDIDTMVREWNDGFFGPRGVTIQRSPYSSRNVSETPATEDPPTSVPEPQPQSQSQEQAPRSRWNPFRPFDVSNRGIRIGRLSIDDDRVSFGDSFEVDRNGVRWNGMSSNDLRFETDNGSRDVPRGPGPSNNFPPGRGGFGDPMGRGRGGRWWKAGPHHHPGHPYGPRSHSPGAHSSASSSSSSSSDSSIGSLPDWDDLRDSQLPITKQSITAWLAHPEQPVTKSMLRAARSEIKAARNAPPPTNDPGWDVSKQALRQEVRSLLARLKDLKREQKKASRATRKERREQKRAAKKERRDRRRADRREMKDARQAARRGEPFDPFGAHAHRGGGLNRAATAPHIPEIHVPPVPSIPPIPGPHFNSPFSGRGGFGFGGRAGFHHPGSRPWEAHVQAAHRQADLARSQSAEHAERARAQADSARAFAASQAGRARVEAQRQADMARAQASEQEKQARAHADSVRAFAAEQEGRARMQAQRQADAARARVEAAVDAWARGETPTVDADLYSAEYSQHQEGMMWGEGDTRGGVGGGNGGNGHKYETADALEAQIAAKRMALLDLRGTIEDQHLEAALRGEAGGKEKSKTEAEVEAEKLENEINDLGRDVQKLRLEADEEMARKMAEEEGWQG